MKFEDLSRLDELVGKRIHISDASETSTLGKVITVESMTSGDFRLKETDKESTYITGRWIHFDIGPVFAYEGSHIAVDGEAWPKNDEP